jgi:hypothetical protein
MQTIGLALALTILTEGIIEYLGTPIPRRFKPYAAALLSTAACVLYNADLLAMLGYSALVPYVGAVLTGLVIGRGSNYVNDLISRLNVVGAPAAMVKKVRPAPKRLNVVGAPAVIVKKVRPAPKS